MYLPGPVNNQGAQSQSSSNPLVMRKSASATSSKKSRANNHKKAVNARDMWNKIHSGTQSASRSSFYHFFRLMSNSVVATVEFEVYPVHYKPTKKEHTAVKLKVKSAVQEYLRQPILEFCEEEKTSVRNMFLNEIRDNTSFDVSNIQENAHLRTMKAISARAKNLDYSSAKKVGLDVAEKAFDDIYRNRYNNVHDDSSFC